MTRHTDSFPSSAVRSVVFGAWAALVFCIAAADRCMASGLPTAEILRYKLSCLLDEENPSLECTADIWVRVLRDSLGSVTFRIPVQSKVISVTDDAGSSIRHRVRPATPAAEEEAQTELLVCELPEGMTINDSLLFRIRYDATEDTASTSELFINEHEFLLQSTSRATWVPTLVASVPNASRLGTSPAVIDMHLPSAFAVFSGGRVDSLESHDGMTTWRITRTDVASWEESFAVAGSKNALVSTVPGAQGRCGIVLSTPQGRFDHGFAHALAAWLGRASEYFAAQHYIPRFDRITIASVGSASVNSEPVVSGGLVIVRTGPQHMVFDSSIFLSSAHNAWLLETARAYAFDVPDSSYWFNESWACYMATRFLFAEGDTSQALQMQERSHILSHALDFYPDEPIASGRRGGTNEDAVFTYKGRYVFMMLEYVLGRETFDAAMRTLYGESRLQPPSVARLQALCEDAYGSSLEWFFSEWLYRTGFPEYVLSSQTQPTARGAYEVTVDIVQRGDVFTMPLNVLVETGSRSFMKRIFVSQPAQRFTFVVSSAPDNVELNSQYLVLRWIPKFRILAHARTSKSFRVFSRDLAASEREGRLTLQLDPANSIGANALALYSLGMTAGARKDWVAADSLFLEASKQHASGELAFYPLLSAVRHANMLDLARRREEALAEYRKALEAAEASPLLYFRVITEARRYLAQPFASTDDFWFEPY